MPITAQKIRGALEELAHKWPDLSAQGGDDLRDMTLAHLPAATVSEFEDYCEAVSDLWALTQENAAPDMFLDDDERAVAPAWTWRDIASQRAEMRAADCLDRLLSHLPALRAVA